MNNRLNYAETHALVEYCRAHVTEHAQLTYDAIAAEASAVLAFPVTYKNVARARREGGLRPRRVTKPKAAPAPAPSPTPAILEQNLAKLIAQNTELLEHLRRLDLRLTENEREIAATQTEVNVLNAAQGRAAPFPVTKPNGASKGARA